MAGLPDFGKQIGPLPLGAWIALVGGGLGIAYVTSRNSGGGGETVEYVENTGVPAGVGAGGTGAYSSTGGGSSSDVPTAVAIVDNEQWGRAVINYLISQGYDANVSDSAIRKYLATEKQSAQEYTLTAIGLGKFGAPPIPLPPPPAAPVTTPTPTAPVPAPPPPVSVPVATPPPPPPPPPSAPQRRTYTVVPGDSLWKIAARFYGNGARWPDIYNANRGGIGGNPNRIYPGQVFVIP